LPWSKHSTIEINWRELGGTPIFPPIVFGEAQIFPLKFKFGDLVFLEAQKKTLNAGHGAKI